VGGPLVGRRRGRPAEILGHRVAGDLARSPAFWQHRRIHQSWPACSSHGNVDAMSDGQSRSTAKLESLMRLLFENVGGSSTMMS